MSESPDTLRIVVPPALDEEKGRLAPRAVEAGHPEGGQMVLLMTARRQTGAHHG